MYLAGVIVFLKSMEEHLGNAKEILRALQNAGLTLTLRKCEFFTDIVMYLDHIIRPRHLAIEELGLKSLKEAKNQKTQTELRSFLSLCNVYRCFIPHFAEIAGSFNELLKNVQPVQMEAFHELEAEAFKSLVDTVKLPPKFALGRSSVPYSIDADARKVKVQRALFQTDGIRERLRIGYLSRR